MGQKPLSRNLWLNETNSALKVNCLLKDSTGYLWLGTDNGLYRYNGNTFTHIEIFTQNAITALAVYNGVIMAGFADGHIGVLEKGKFTFLQLSGEIPASAVSSINSIGGGMYLLSTLGEGVFVVQNGYCLRYSVDNGLPDDYVYNLKFTSDSSVIITTDLGIQHLCFRGKERDTTDFTTTNGLPDNIVRVISPMRDTCLSWIGTQQGGLAMYCAMKNETWVPGGVKHWQWGQVNDILPLQDRRAWVCTEDGYLLNVALSDNDSLQVKAYYYPGEKLYKLLMDATANIWCATNSGLKNIPAEYLETINIPDPYSLQELTAICSDGLGNMWFAQKNKLYYFDINNPAATVKHVFTNDKLITKIYWDGYGRMWIGTFGDGLWCWSNNRFRKVTDIPMLQTESVLDIGGVDRELWIAGLNGVQEYREDEYGKLTLIRLHTKSSGIGSDYVYNIYPDKEGKAWMATDGAGVCMYRNGKYKHWDSTSGMTAKVCYSITEDAREHVWVGTFGKGVMVSENNKWIKLDAKYGLQNLKVTAIAPTQNGTVLVVHAAGVDEWHNNDKEFRHFDRRLGVNVDSLSTTLNLTARDASGRVYVPYQDGLLRFGNYAYPTDVTPGIRINYINEYVIEGGTSKRAFDYSENYINFKYDGINFTNPRRHYYRYKLEGYSDDWIYTMDESIIFAKLPGGDYKFVVQVSLNEMFTSYGEDSYWFSVDKPFWQELWFILLMAAIVWTMIIVYTRLRERSLRRLSQLQRERMMFEYEHLKSQVNPHFLFNSLNTLTALIEDDSNVARDYTSRLSDLYRNMLSHKDKDLILLSEEWAIVENFVYIQKSRFGDALQLDAQIPDSLLRVKKVVPMALQILIENAMKHNIVSKDSPLVITVRVEGETIVVANNYQPKKSKERGAGLGLLNIKQRYALHTDREVNWSVQNGQFIVSIPLI